MPYPDSLMRRTQIDCFCTGFTYDFLRAELCGRSAGNAREILMDSGPGIESGIDCA